MQHSVYLNSADTHPNPPAELYTEAETSTLSWEMSVWKNWHSLSQKKTLKPTYTPLTKSHGRCLKGHISPVILQWTRSMAHHSGCWMVLPPVVTWLWVCDLRSNGTLLSCLQSQNPNRCSLEPEIKPSLTCYSPFGIFSAISLISWKTSIYLALE